MSVAHDLWLERRGDLILLIHGHMDKADPYDPERVVSWILFDKKGHRLNINPIKGNGSVSFEDKAGRIGLINITFDNKYWVKTNEGWKNIGKREALKEGFQILESGRSMKFAKYLQGWHRTFAEPLHTEMEIIPLNNPFKSKTLKIKVLHKGKPLANVPIYLQASHEEKLKTDAQGLAEIELRKGLNIISSKTRVTTEGDPDADSIYLRASLSFIK